MTGPVTVDLERTLGAVPAEADVVQVAGPDAATYLQGQLSQDVAALAVGAGAPTLVLHPTGKLLAWGTVVRIEPDTFVLVVPAGVGDEVGTRLRRFLLRTDATVAVGRRSGWTVCGPGAVDVAAAVAGAVVAPLGWPDVEAVLVLGGADAEGRPELPEGVLAADAADLVALRVVLGVPELAVDVLDGAIPAEAGRWLIDGGVSFTKGCYVGQELVARVDSRGSQVPRPVRTVVVDAPAEVAAAGLAGAAVLADGAEVGRLTTVVRVPGVGLAGLGALPRALGPDGEVKVEVVAGEARWPAVVAASPLRGPVER